MKINIKAMAYALAIVWGAAVLLTGLANFWWPPYGQTFLEVVASIYPGYRATPGFLGIIVGTLYALLDGLVGGLILGALYNAFAGKQVSEAGREAVAGKHQTP